MAPYSLTRLLNNFNNPRVCLPSGNVENPKCRLETQANVAPVVFRSIMINKHKHGLT